MSGSGRRGLPGVPGVSVQADRRFRRTDASVDRRRRTRRLIWRMGGWTLPVVAVSAATWWVATTLLQVEALRVQEISIEGNHRLSSAEVEHLVEGLRSENILKVNFDRYERRLLDSPWVADVTLFRALPARITIQVVERVPMAIARISGELFLVDRTGVVIDEYGQAHREIDLPLVDGLTDPGASSLTPVPERVQLAQACLMAFESSPGLFARLSQVDVSNPHDAVVVLDDDAALLHLGAERFAERLQGYLDLRPTLRDRYRRMDYVDLRFDGRVYLNGTALIEAPAP
jgi:cell division septal protein FtsQ